MRPHSHYEPDGGDLSMPSQRAAALTGRARASQHGRFWANDADCLSVSPQVQRRDAWAMYVDHCGGLRSSGDRLGDLDDWGLYDAQAAAPHSRAALRYAGALTAGSVARGDHHDAPRADHDQRRYQRAGRDYPWWRMRSRAPRAYRKSQSSKRTRYVRHAGMRRGTDRAIESASARHTFIRR
jgi:hypothetical protein